MVRAPLGWLGPGQLAEDITVVIEEGRIRDVRSGPPWRTADAPQPSPRIDLGQLDEVIDVDGFLIPGVVDRHVHVAMSDPGEIVRNGVTAVRDLGWRPEDVLPLAAASDSPSFDGPTIRAVGPILTCPGGYPTRAGWAPHGTGLELDSTEQAVAAVDRVLDANGIPVVKVALNSDAGPTLADHALLAICDAAHRREAIVTVHAQGRGQVERALGAGVDEFAHCPWSEVLREDLIEAIAKRARIVSTLDIHSYGSNTPELTVALDNLRRFLLAGGTVTYGTDLGNGPIPAGIHTGEIAHLFRAGLSPEGILRALTFRPIEAGQPADLVALGDNPLQTADAYGEVRLVIRGGRRVR